MDKIKRWDYNPNPNSKSAEKRKRGVSKGTKQEKKRDKNEDLTKEIASKELITGNEFTF